MQACLREGGTSDTLSPLSFPKGEAGVKGFPSAYTALGWGGGSGDCLCAYLNLCSHCRLGGMAGSVSTRRQAGQASPWDRPRKVEALDMWSNCLSLQGEAGAWGFPCSHTNCAKGRAYGKSTPPISYSDASVWLLSLVGYRNLSASFWISHKGNSSVYCGVSTSVEERMLLGFLLCLLAEPPSGTLPACFQQSLAVQSAVTGTCDLFCMKFNQPG